MRFVPRQRLTTHHSQENTDLPSTILILLSNIDNHHTCDQQHPPSLHTNTPLSLLHKAIHTEEKPPLPTMCRAQSTTFSQCNHIIDYKIFSRCPQWSWWNPCPAWHDPALPQVRDTDRPYCRDCYCAKVAAIRKKYTVREARVIEEGTGRGWSVEETWRARMVVRGEMEGKVGALGEWCLGGGGR